MSVFTASRVRRWNVIADCTIELETIGREVHVSGDAGRVPELDGWMPADTADDRNHGWELVIEFRSRGYSDPGKLYGPPERCYPPESDDERTLVNAYLVRSPIAEAAEAGEAIRRVKLPTGVQEEVFERFREEVEAAELPDYDD